MVASGLPPPKSDGATVDVPQLKATARLAFEQHEPVSGRKDSTAHLRNLVHAEARLQWRCKRQFGAAFLSHPCDVPATTTSTPRVAMLEAQMPQRRYGVPGWQ